MSESFNFKSILDQAIRIAIADLWFIFKQIFIIYWPYIVGFFVVIISGIILQIIMLRSGSRSKLSSGFNSMVGGLTYVLFCLFYFAISYWIFGSQVVDEIWFTAFGGISFLSTWLFLRAIGFWYY